MRVINTTTLQLEDIDPTADESHYAILSHTWGSDEVLFDDVRNLGPNELTRLVHKKGTSKVSKACAQAKREGYKYIWIDTCCIDKSSSAELSEAINSMFQWYAQADICYAYLDDVTANDDDLQSTLYRNSRWFKRGWTLQELIAPLHLVFFDHAWVRIGIRSSFSSEIAEITSIDKSLLDRHRTSDSSDNMVDLTRDLAAMDVSTRMSWARFRETTRGEDLAYCLMGLFDVNMPLLYGEGGEKAFVRLQREIIAGRSDQSILAWTPLDYPTNGGRWGRGQVSLLARSPRVRFLVGAEQHLSSSSLTEFSLHGNRIRATVFLGKIYCHAGAWPEYHQTYIAVLNFQARDSSSFVDRPALRLRNLPQAQGDAIYQKINNSILWVKMLHDGKISVSQRDGTSSANILLKQIEFKLMTIDILINPEPGMEKYSTLTSLSQFTPPLTLTMSTKTYQLRGSTAEHSEQWGSFAPSFLTTETWKWFAPCQNTSTIRTGTLLFLPTSTDLPRSRCGFLVVWAVSLPISPNWGQEMDEENDDKDTASMTSSWWTQGDPVLCVLPCSQLRGDLPSKLEEPGEWCTGGGFLKFLQAQFKTMDGLFGEAQDHDCACWVTGSAQHHIYAPDGARISYSKAASMIKECEARLRTNAKAAAERWTPRMVPEEKVTLGGVTVIASIRKLQFLDRTSFSLEIKTRPADTDTDDSDLDDSDMTDSETT